MCLTQQSSKTDGSVQVYHRSIGRVNQKSRTDIISVHSHDCALRSFLEYERSCASRRIPIKYDGISVTYTSILL
ncbi:uncharacterized protein RAG0_11850 [Rhynchosporium agropyri]|uniref:Uncharacterized protein n=1 Tax=Rhynchosporium agropyri TaxID=914238 RepID=A0A1E1L683_9HELO|nr:uncharacterized protein RAG0_11850 [Rhynchosporium agropyri]